MAARSDERQKADDVAQAFVAARRAARPLPIYPGAEPADLAAAYRIQDAAIAAAGGRIAGWKVGRIHAPLDTRYGADRLAGPIFADQVVSVGDAAPAAMRVFDDGFGAAEAEFLLRLGPVDPARHDYDLAAALGAVAAVHVGIEIASSPFPGINDRGPAVTVSDFGNNNGLLVGPAVPDWRVRGIEDWIVSTEIDGAVVGEGVAAAFPDGLAGAVRFLLETLAARGIAVAEGCWISSGAVTGVHPVRPGARVRARFGDEFTVDCRIAAEEPRG